MIEQENTPQNNPLRLRDLLFWPAGCLLSLSPYLVLGGATILLAVGAFIFYNMNVDLFGLGAPDFANLSFDNTYEHVKGKDGSWVISYESENDSTFTGLVRHISPIREVRVPLLTHDILITSGDYADPQKVTTSVSNHHFSWVSRNRQQPQGKINLLHAVPLNQGIYQQLLQIQSGQQVSITGWEILKIEAFDLNGRLQGGWQDSGCNTLIITSVQVQTP